MRIGNIVNHLDKNTDGLGPVIEINTAAIPTRGEPLRDLGVGRLQDGIETARTCKHRKQNGSSIMPAGESTAREMKWMLLGVNLRN